MQVYCLRMLKIILLKQLNIHKAYWIEDPLEIRSKVLKNLKLFSLETNMLSRNSIVTEKCCNVLKYGFRKITGSIYF